MNAIKVNNKKISHKIRLYFCGLFLVVKWCYLVICPKLARQVPKACPLTTRSPTVVPPEGLAVRTVRTVRSPPTLKRCCPPEARGRPSEAAVDRPKPCRTARSRVILTLGRTPKPALTARIRSRTAQTVASNRPTLATNLTSKSKRLPNFCHICLADRQLCFIFQSEYEIRRQIPRNTLNKSNIDNIRAMDP